METLKNVMYAGIGLAHHTEDKMKEKFNVLVEKGKEVDAEGKNIVGDLLKSLEEFKETTNQKYSEVLNDNIEKVEGFLQTLKQ